MMILDVLVCLMVLVIGANFKKRFKMFNAYDFRLLNKLFMYHLLLGIVFYLYLISAGGDALSYWFVLYTDTYDFSNVVELLERGSATGFMLLLNYIPAKLLGLSLFTGGMLYALLGYMGFVYFYAILKENVPELYELRKKKIVFISVFPTLFFLPNLHFWSSGIGKDTLLFFCIALFIYSIKHIKKRFMGITIAVLLSIFVRPHITLFLLVAFGIGFTMDGRLQAYQKIFIFLLFAGGMALMYPYVMQFVKLESLDTETISAYSDRRIESLSQDRTDSAVDTSNYPFPVKMFTFLYRPFFIDGMGVLGLAASFENLILLLFSLKLLVSKPFNAFAKGDFLMKGVLVFFVIGTMAFSLILGNMGIMLRQKTPFIMALLIFGFWTLLLKKTIK